MSSSGSSSSSSLPEAPPGKKRSGSVGAVVVSVGLLALLVWAMAPSRSRFQPAPLHPAPAGCPKNLPDFVPSDATVAPGLDLNTLSAPQRNHLLYRVNMEPCPCGCNLSLVACRFSHPACPASKESIERIIADERRSPGALPVK